MSVYIYICLNIENSVLWLSGFVGLRKFGRDIANLHVVPQIIRLLVKEAKKDK